MAVASFQRVVTDGLPFPSESKGLPIWTSCRWPARWIATGLDPETPLVMALRLRVVLTQRIEGLCHITSDECHEFFCNNQLVDSGPEFGDEGYWCYRSFRFALDAGEHLLFAKVWAAGQKAPLARIGVRPGFLLAAEGSPEIVEKISTGSAPWEAKTLPGYRWIDSPLEFDGFTGKKQELDASLMDFEGERGLGTGWQAATPNAEAHVPHPIELHPHRLLSPAVVPQGVWPEPPQLHCKLAERIAPEADLAELATGAGRPDPAVVEAFSKLASHGTPVELPPRGRWRVLMDSNTYLRAILRITAVGHGGTIEASWAESLYLQPASLAENEKAHRGEFLGKFFRGYTDRFKFSSTRGSLRPLWWQCGRWIQLDIRTGDEALVISECLPEPVESLPPAEAVADCDDERWRTLAPILQRTVVSNSFGGLFLDCPYYEQLAYLEDARIQALIGYTMRTDDSIARKMLALFAGARSADGFLPSRYPCRVRQIIPSFSLLWIEMLHDFALWRGDVDFVRPFLPEARLIVEKILAHRNSDGLVGGLPDWNFLDWADGWLFGFPDACREGNSATLNLLVVRSLHRLAELEQFAGIPVLELHWLQEAKTLHAATSASRFHSGRGFYLETKESSGFSLHAQLFAVLCDEMETAEASDLLQRALNDASLTQPSLYFQHYLFEALYHCGLADKIWPRLGPWWQFSECGLTTTPERQEPTRSDCHAWTCHPWFHFFASVLGIRPARLGSSDLIIRPARSGPENIQARLPWRGGTIELTRKNSAHEQRIFGTLPPGVQAEIISGDQRQVVRGIFDCTI